ncbi:DUF3515 domain-containing protein [Gordonia sp. (in: high G+C Gram-positive bacteria)]|uniref:DUF3515 domain-containing protein n=1 Tax=Gordonia sp. (in: high G+C Gram-positive bacteria) TaxID=84139 RepID=UPI003C7733BD
MSDGTDKPTTDSPKETPEEPKLSPALIATLVAVPTMVIIGFLVYAAMNFSSAPDEEKAAPVESYGTVQADVAKCTEFIKVLPTTLGDYSERTIDGTTVRWDKPGEQPVVLRCGVTRPAGLAPTSSLQVINPIQWFMTDSVEGEGQAYVSVDHRPYVAMWVPVGAGNAPITDVSALIDQHLPRAPLDFGPA